MVILHRSRVQGDSLMLLEEAEAVGPCRDEDWGFQLYQSDPSGNYGGWKATAIGANKQAAQNLLKQDYEEDISTEKAIKLVIKVPPSTLSSSRPCVKARVLLACTHLHCH